MVENNFDNKCPLCNNEANTDTANGILYCDSNWTNEHIFFYDASSYIVTYEIFNFDASSKLYIYIDLKLGVSSTNIIKYKGIDIVSSNYNSYNREFTLTEVKKYIKFFNEGLVWW